VTTCQRLEEWLDAGRPAAEAAELGAHTAACARCAAALVAADELEASLRADPAARAPAWLAPAVMREVEAARRPRAAPVRPLDSRRALAWWSAAGLATGAAGWGVVELLGSGGAGAPGATAAWLHAPDGAVALAAISTLAAAGLTWASLRLARAFELAALGMR